MMQEINKAKIIELFYEYNYRAKKKAKINFDNKMVGLKIGDEFEQMTMEQAYEYLNKLIQNLPKVKISMGKGYIGNSMSVNAKLAHNNGIRPKSFFSAKKLQALGFNYSYDFFKWLVDSKYILPKERHHTSAAKNYTNFYSEDSIRYAVDMMNLDLLYQLYNKEITKSEAKKIRGIKYAKVRVLDTLLGGKSGTSIIVNCLTCDGVVFISDKLCFLENDQRAEIIEVYLERPSNFKNDKLKALPNKLIKRKTKTFLKNC